jgi:hypothetical protein
MLNKLILLVVLLMAIAVPYASADPADNQLVIHWKFDNDLKNYGSTRTEYDLPLPASPPPSYTTGLDSVGALSFSPDDTESLQSVMGTIGKLELTNATVSFNLKQRDSWNHYLLLADADGKLLSLYINGISVQSVATTNPIGVLKSPTLSKTWLSISSSLSDGAIDDFRIYNYIIDTVAINALSHPALYDTVNTDDSANVSIDEIVNYMKKNNAYDPTLAARLLDLIKPIF